MENKRNIWLPIILSTHSSFHLSIWLPIELSKLTHTLVPPDSHQHPSILCVWTLSQLHIYQEKLDHLLQLKLILLHPPVHSLTRVQWAAGCNEHMGRAGSLLRGIAQYLCKELVLLTVLQNRMSQLFSLHIWETWRKLLQPCLDISQFLHSVYEINTKWVGHVLMSISHCQSLKLHKKLLLHWK
jgi:hypothetical protein